MQDSSKFMSHPGPPQGPLPDLAWNGHVLAAKSAMTSGPGLSPFRTMGSSGGRMPDLAPPYRPFFPGRAFLRLMREASIRMSARLVSWEYLVPPFPKWRDG